MKIGIMRTAHRVPARLLELPVDIATLRTASRKDRTGAVSKRREEMLCIVEDDGIGRLQAAALNSNNLHDSKAIAIVLDRLKLFDEHTSFEIIDLELDGIPGGTKVIITLPIKYTVL